MTFLKVLLIVFAVLWLISRLRVGADAQYKEEKLFLRVIAGPFRLTILPAKEKKAEKKTSPQKEKKKKQPEGEGTTGRAKSRRKLPPIMDLLLLAIEAAGELKRKIRVDRLIVHLLWASSDPADTAVGFGRMNAAVGMLWALIENNFKVKDHDLGVAVDFDRAKPAVDCDLALTFTIGQLLSFGVRFAVKFLILWRRSGKSSGNDQEVTNHERKESSHQ